MSLWKHIKCGWDVFSSFVSREVGDALTALEPSFGMTFDVGNVL
jgi:hypothetical protein